MARKTNILITSSVEEKGAYGVTTDTNEKVYVSAGAADKLAIAEFDELEAIVVPNERSAEIPLYALRVRRLDDI